jgi:hypothetical protein
METCSTGTGVLQSSPKKTSPFGHSWKLRAHRTFWIASLDSSNSLGSSTAFACTLPTPELQSSLRWKRFSGLTAQRKPQKTTQFSCLAARAKTCKLPVPLCFEEFILFRLSACAPQQRLHLKSLRTFPPISLSNVSASPASQ